MYLNKMILLTFFLFLSCSSIKPKVTKPVELKPADIKLQPGRVAFSRFSIPDGWEEAKLMCKDKVLPYTVEGQKGDVYLSESYFSNKQPYKCYLKMGKKQKLVFKVRIANYSYKEEKLRVNRKKVVLSKKDLARVIKEKEALKKVYAKSSPTPYFTKPFIAPLNSYVTSDFGTRRVFNGIKKGQHLGIDFRAAVGVPLPSSNRGKVVFVGDLFYTGNTVIIDHGLDIFMVYAHMSETLVSQGDIVEQGDILGKAGMTGRVSGPHLHWGVKVHGNRVSGFSLMDASKKHL